MVKNWNEMKSVLVKNGLLKSREQQFKELIEKGRVLKQVREEKLYKHDFSTFSSFVMHEFEITPQQAANLINTSIVYDSIENGQPLPKTIKECIKLYRQR